MFFRSYIFNEYSGKQKNILKNRKKVLRKPDKTILKPEEITFRKTNKKNNKDVKRDKK